jgi:hypothetical protein
MHEIRGWHDPERLGRRILLRGAVAVLSAIAVSAVLFLLLGLRSIDALTAAVSAAIRN